MSEILSEDSFFDFKCPECGQINSFPESSAHTLQECAACAESLIVPEKGAQTGVRLPLPISTARLVVRPFHHEDAVALLRLVVEDESSTLPISETDVDQWIGSQLAARFTRSERGVYLGIELAENKVLVGYVLPYYTDGFRNTAGFNVTIAPARRRQGLGLEVIRALIDFIFDGLCARRISVSCLSQNVGGRRMLEKAGMRQEGEFVKSWFDGNEWVNMCWYALLKEERPATAP